MDDRRNKNENQNPGARNLSARKGQSACGSRQAEDAEEVENEEPIRNLPELKLTHSGQGRAARTATTPAYAVPLNRIARLQREQEE
jgi:hypothetical protein